MRVQLRVSAAHYPRRTRMSLLTEPRIRAAKPKQKPYKLRDGRGLYLLIQPSGARLWRLRFRQPGRESMVSLGAYPDVSLKVARERREETRKAIAAGIDPAAQRRAERAGHENTFQAIAGEAQVCAEDFEESSVDSQRPALSARWLTADRIDHCARHAEGPSANRRARQTRDGPPDQAARE